MITILAFLIGAGGGLWLDRERTRRIRAERNLARRERDLAQQDLNQAMRGNVVVLDPKMRQDKPIHPAYRNLGRVQR